MRLEISKIMTQDKVMELVYGNSSEPKRVLGRHYVKDGQVIAAYHPDAVAMRVIGAGGRSYPMEPVERQPVYTLYLPHRRPFPYRIEMRFQDGNTLLAEDPYRFPCQITSKEEAQFRAGVWGQAYQKLGCHPMRIQGVDGMYFAVWAPGARRVSVVGDFNFWNGMTCPMNRMGDSGIFELFLPEVREDRYYKFEIKTMQGEVVKKTDPFAMAGEDGGGYAAKTVRSQDFFWTDAVFMKNRRYKNTWEAPILIQDIGRGDRFLAARREWNEDSHIDENEFEAAFTHILLSNYMGDEEGSGGIPRQSGLCMPFYCGGSSAKLMRMINEAHNRGVGVLMELPVGHFGREDGGLVSYDGTSLFGYSDERMQMEETRNRYRFCYERGEVRSYLLSSILFWMQAYHIDGFFFEGVADLVRSGASGHFGETPGEYLEALFREIRLADSSVLLLGDEAAGEAVRDARLFADGKGFDFVWNYALKRNLDVYCTLGAEEKRREHFRITLPLQKNGLEHALLTLNNKKAARFPQSAIDKSAGDDYDKLSERKLACGFLMGMPGRKIWAGALPAQPYLRHFLRDLFAMYRQHPALYEFNTARPSFSWVNGMDAAANVVSFIRRSDSGKSLLLFLCNFSAEERIAYRVGAPKYGEYTEILNSDAKEYGGSGRFAGQNPSAQRVPYDFHPFSIEVNLPPESILVFRLW